MSDNDINSRLFGPGLPSSGKPSVCRVEPRGLYLPEIQQLIHFAALETRVGSFDHNQLQLCWQYQDYTWMLIPEGRNAQQALIEQLPKKDVKGLGRWKRSTFGQSLVWKTVVTTLCLLAIGVALLVWRYDDVVTWVAGRVPMATEYEIGQSVLTSLKNQTSLQEKGIAVDAVKKIGDRLTKGSRFQYHWYVSDDKAINAFALPGGNVIVNKGLIEKAESANEVAGVLAHEVQHVEQRHALKNIITSSGIAAGVLLLLGDANAMLMVLTHNITSLYFSRQAESEADMKGVALLHQTKVDPSGLATFFKKMQDNSKGKEGGFSWLSSHPNTGERIKAVQDYNQAHPCEGCETLKWDKKAILASLEKTPPPAKKTTR
ncbi:MAG: M48 family metallopeptidase [Gammaproteobacteria bacterium]|nr:M48 family metallopeptidase [Gammaproteobacteria bacterium]